ncbi:ABC transporter ATP-binding protein [Pedobacter sp. SYSU D00535]|uniref:ABC transporter ATP-binding protein n=1 Tax=Pedobacter sp. SYSU D00535 TaxID=2810308 RepID=UPI001A96BDF0|nr:ABC transporter ATP-binding protein [Pedobacter sp. SYSU D00535]
MADISCEVFDEDDQIYLPNIPQNRIITVQNVTKKYSEVPFSGVDNASFAIDKGKIVAIVGESGSGKSTLLKLIYGLMTPEKGHVFFRSELIKGPEKKLIPGHEAMKMVTQDFSLNTYAKVYDNIASMLPNTNLKYKVEKTESMLQLLRISHLAQKRVADLSGGEQQRVAIAKAIVTEPEVLLMDEPFSQVDTMLKSQLRADLRRLSHELGITILIVSHDPVDGLSLADELVVIRRGAVLETGSPAELYNRPRHLYTAKLLSDCNVLEKDAAEKIGVQVKKTVVGIRLEDVQLIENFSSGKMRVVDRFFKGYGEEVLLERSGVLIRALNLEVEKFQVGDLLDIGVKKVLSFD